MHDNVFTDMHRKAIYNIIGELFNTYFLLMIAGTNLIRKQLGLIQRLM